MTIARIKPANWAVNEKLTSAQMNDVDTNITFTLDKRTGNTDTLSSAITVDATGSIIFANLSHLTTIAGAIVVFGSANSFTGVSTFSGASSLLSSGIVTLSGTNTISGTLAIGATTTITATSINWNTGLSDVTFGSTDTVSNGVTAHSTTIKGQNATGLITGGGDVNIEAGKGTLIDGSVKIKSDGVTLATFAPTTTTINNATTISAGSLTVSTGSVVVSNSGVAANGGPITADGGFVGSYGETIAYAAAVGVDLITANHFEFGTLTGNITLNISNMIPGGYYTFYFKQDGTGGRTVSFSGATDIEFSGAAPNTAANKTNIYTCIGHRSGINDFLLVTSIVSI